MPERVEPVAEPAGARLGEIVGVAGEPAVHLLGVAVHAKRGVQVVDVELGPLAVAPDLVGRGAVGAVVGALDGVPDLMGGQLAGEVLAVSPAVQAAVADVVIVVHGADVVAGVAAAVPPGVVDGVNARVGPEPVPVGGLGVPPDLADVLRQPADLAAADVGVQVDRAVVVAVVQLGAADGGRTSAPASWPAGQSAARALALAPCDPSPAPRPMSRGLAAVPDVPACFHPLRDARLPCGVVRFRGRRMRGEREEGFVEVAGRRPNRRPLAACRRAGR